MANDPTLPRDQLIYLIVEPAAAGKTALRFSRQPPSVGEAQAAFRLRGKIMDGSVLDVDLITDIDAVDLPPGPAGTLTIRSVNTGAPGSSAAVTNAGTLSAALLDIILPAGRDATPVTTDQIAGAVGTYIAAHPPAAGKDAVAPTVKVGKVTTLAAGAPAAITNSGTATAVSLDFGIPIGAPAASLLATVALLDKTTVTLSAGVRSVTVTGIAGLKAGDGVIIQPVAVPPAGYAITSAVATADGVLTVTLVAPLLAAGAQTTIAIRVFKISA